MQAVDEANRAYCNRMHNLCCDNCHSHCCRALQVRTTMDFYPDNQRVLPWKPTGFTLIITVLFSDNGVRGAESLQYGANFECYSPLFTDFHWLSLLSIDFLLISDWFSIDFRLIFNIFDRRSCWRARVSSSASRCRRRGWFTHLRRFWSLWASGGCCATDKKSYDVCTCNMCTGMQFVTPWPIAHAADVHVGCDKGREQSKQTTLERHKHSSGGLMTAPREYLS